MHCRIKQGEDMDHNQLKNEIDRGVFRRIYLFHGPENFVKDRLLARLVNSAVNEFKQLNVVKFWEDAEADDIIAACETLPAFSNYRVVICKDSLMLKDSEYPDIAKLVQYLDRVADKTILVFYLHGTADKANALYKKLTQHCIVEFKQIIEREIEDFLTKDAKQKGLSIQKEAVWKIIEYVGKDMYRITGEIEKAFCYIYPRTHLIVEDLEAVATRTDEADAFVTADLIFAGEIKKASSKLDTLIADGANAYVVIGAFGYRLRQLIEARMLLDSGVEPAEAVNRFKIPRYFAQKIVQLAQKLSLNKLEKMIGVLAETDFLLKSGRMQEHAALKYAAARIISQRLSVN